MSAGEHIILLMYVEIAMNLIHAYTWQSVFVQLEKVKIYRAEFVCGRTETVQIVLKKGSLGGYHNIKCIPEVTVGHFKKLVSVSIASKVQ